MKLLKRGGPVPMMLALILALTMSSASKSPSGSGNQSSETVDLEAKRAENLKRFERLDNRRYCGAPLQARGRGGKSHRRSPSLESEGTQEASPMSLEKAIEELAGSGNVSPMISDTSISPPRSDATPPPYGIFHFELEEKASDLHMSVNSMSSDTEDAFARPPPFSKTAASLDASKKKNETQSQSLPIDIPKREIASPSMERATQSQSTGSDTFIDRARLSRELERVRAMTENKSNTK